MKLIVSTAVALLLAGQAFAGALVFEAPEEPVVVAEPAPMGGSNAAWIIPVIGLAAIAYAISNDDDDDDDTEIDRRRRLILAFPAPRLAGAGLELLRAASRALPFSFRARRYRRSSKRPRAGNRSEIRNQPPV